MNTRTRTVVTLFAAGACLAASAEAAPSFGFPGENGSIVYTRDGFNRETRNGLYVMDARGNRRRKMSDRGSEPTYSPDGRRLLTTQYDPELPGTRIHLGSRSDASPELVPTTSNRETADSVHHHSPAWAPDGNRFVFVATSWSYDETLEEYSTFRELYVHDLTTGESTQLTRADDRLGPSAIDPAWSPDGSVIAFSRAANHYSDYGSHMSPADLFTIAPDGSDVTRLSNTPRISENAASWAPTGRRLAYSREQPGYERGGGRIHLGLGIMRRDGSNGRKLTATGDSAPSWSPNGNSIVAARLCCGPGETSNPKLGIWKFNLARGTRTRLVPGFRNSDPDWGVRPSR